MVRAELLEINGFDFIDIQEFYSELKPNKHGKAFIGGTIRGDKKRRIFIIRRKGDTNNC